MDLKIFWQVQKKRSNIRFIKEYLSRRLNTHTQKTTLHLFLRIHVYLNKHGRAYILIHVFLHKGGREMMDAWKK